MGLGEHAVNLGIYLHILILIIYVRFAYWA